MYPALDRCVMPDLLRCPSLPCQSDDTRRSTRKIPLSNSDVKRVQGLYLWSTGEEELAAVKCPSSGREAGTDACFVELSHRD